MVRETNKRVVEGFAKKVKRDYADAEVILFGSRAREEEMKDSDYDVVVVSGAFEGVNFFRRTEIMYEYWNRDELLEAFCYTPKEFGEKKEQIGTVQNAVKTGIKIEV